MCYESESFCVEGVILWRNMWNFNEHCDRCVSVPSRRKRTTTTRRVNGKWYTFFILTLHFSNVFSRKANINNNWLRIRMKWKSKHKNAWRVKCTWRTKALKYDVCCIYYCSKYGQVHICHSPIALSVIWICTVWVSCLSSVYFIVYCCCCCCSTVGWLYTVTVVVSVRHCQHRWFLTYLRLSYAR